MSFACRHLKEAFVDENGESLYKTRMIQVLGYSTLYPSIRKLFVGYVPGENSISRDVKARIYPFLFLDWVTSGLDPNSMRDFGKILALGRLGHRDVKKLDKMLVSSLMERVFGSLCEEEKFEMKMARTWYERLFKEKVVASYLKGLRSISTEWQDEEYGEELVQPHAKDKKVGNFMERILSKVKIMNEKQSEKSRS